MTHEESALGYLHICVAECQYYRDDDVNRGMRDGRTRYRLGVDGMPLTMSRLRQHLGPHKGFYSEAVTIQAKPDGMDMGK